MSSGYIIIYLFKSISERLLIHGAMLLLGRNSASRVHNDFVDLAQPITPRITKQESQGDHWFRLRNSASHCRWRVFAVHLTWNSQQKGVVHADVIA